MYYMTRTIWHATLTHTYTIRCDAEIYMYIYIYALLLLTWGGNTAKWLSERSKCFKLIINSLSSGMSLILFVATRSFFSSGSLHTATGIIRSSLLEIFKVVKDFKSSKLSGKASFASALLERSSTTKLLLFFFLMFYVFIFFFYFLFLVERSCLCLHACIYVYIYMYCVYICMFVVLLQYFKVVNEILTTRFQLHSTHLLRLHNSRGRAAAMNKRFFPRYNSVRFVRFCITALTPVKLFESRLSFLSWGISPTTSGIPENWLWDKSKDSHCVSVLSFGGRSFKSWWPKYTSDSFLYLERSLLSLLPMSMLSCRCSRVGSLWLLQFYDLWIIIV